MFKMVGNIVSISVCSSNNTPSDSASHFFRGAQFTRVLVNQPFAHALVM